MLARYARRVWGVTEQDDIKAAELGILFRRGEALQALKDATVVAVRETR